MAHIWGWWLDCYTQEEIAEKVGISDDVVNRVLREIATLPNRGNFHNLDLSDAEGILITPESSPTQSI